MSNSQYFVIIILIWLTSEFLVVTSLFLSSEFKLSEDGRLNFKELSLKYGHYADNIAVVTEDGYILQLNHIPGDKDRAVLLVHGNTPTADCWIIRGEISLAITLANLGYDVWAINLRGTTFSRRHTRLDPDRNSQQFFNFSFYEQAVYDLPATIDFILRETGQTQLLTIGHSVGTTQFYILGAERPEYNDKIKLAISLSPISFLENVKGIVASGIALGPLITKIASILNIHEVGRKQFGSLSRAVCLEPFGYEICVKGILSALLGNDIDGFERSFLPTLMGHVPGGSSMKTLEHLLQVARRKRFAKFDYGRVRNIAAYGSPEPPDFDLSKVTMKTALMMGKMDLMGSVADSQKLAALLPNIVYNEVLPYDRFNHGDFIWGRHMPINFYPYLLRLIEKYI